MLQRPPAEIAVVATTLAPISAFTLALSLVAATSGIAMAAPPEEHDAYDMIVPSEGWGFLANQTFYASLDGFVLANGGSYTTAASLAGWKRTSAGERQAAWEWNGPITVAGLPPAGTMAPGRSLLATDGLNTVAFMRSTSKLCVLRYAGGAWSYSGSADIDPSMQVTAIAVSGSRLAYATLSSIHLLAHKPDGHWALTSSTSIYPIFPGYPRIALRFSADALVVTGNTSHLYAELGMVHTAIAPIDAASVLGAPMPIPPPFPHSWRLGPNIAMSPAWFAAESHTVGEADSRIAFYRVLADGTMQLAQVAAAPDERPVSISASRMITDRAIWTLGADNMWHRGPEIDAGRSSSIQQGDCVAPLLAGQSPALHVWANPFDCDGDGMDDALAIAAGLASDCNVNGRPDSCDLMDGLLPDTNANGLPDPCEADCDGNGIPDLQEIRQGAPTSCEGPTTLASCAIAAGAVDHNADGIVDACGPDLDGDGVPDATQLASLSGTDCNHDGVPDAVPTYRVDVAMDQTWYWGATGQPRGAVGAWYPTSPDERWLTGMRFQIHSSWLNSAGQSIPPDCDPLGKPYTAFIAADPNGDGYPDDAQLLWYGVSTMAHSAEQFIAFPPVLVDAPAFFAGYIGAPGVFMSPSATCGFFKGSARCNQNPPLLIGTSAACGRALVGLLSSSVPIDSPPNLSTFIIEDFMPDISVFSQVCRIPEDLNGDGVVGGADLGALLALWGPSSGTTADLNHDGAVDGLDLGLLLSAWTME